MLEVSFLREFATIGGVGGVRVEEQQHKGASNRQHLPW
jgi:hypothetical protein